MGTKANIRVYQTVEHPCGYWPERQARDLVLDPVDPMLPGLYGPSLAMGFRRSGSHVYRPHCATCQACTPVRIPVERFRPSRSQRRCLERNAGLRIDHLLLNPVLAPCLGEAGVDTWVRGRPHASDHAPAWVTLDLSKLASHGGR